jgi:hypothetical protein
VSKADRFRTAGLARVLVGGAAWLAFTFSKQEPIVDWLFFRYATYWALSFGWLVACLSAGGMALDRLTRRTFRVGEGLALGFGLGRGWTKRWRFSASCRQPLPRRSSA